MSGFTATSDPHNVNDHNQAAQLLGGINSPQDEPATEIIQCDASITNNIDSSVRRSYFLELTAAATATCFNLTLMLNKSKIFINYLMRTKLIFKALQGLKTIINEIKKNQYTAWLAELDRVSTFFKSLNFINNGTKFLYYLNQAAHPHAKQSRTWIYSQLAIRGILFGAYIADFIAESTPLNFITSSFSAFIDICEIIKLTITIQALEKTRRDKEKRIIEILMMMQDLQNSSLEQRRAWSTELDALSKTFHLTHSSLQANKKERLTASWLLCMSLLGLAITVVFLYSPFIGGLLSASLALTKVSHLTSTYVYDKIKNRNTVKKPVDAEPTPVEINQSVDLISIKIPGFSQGVSCSTAISLFKQKVDDISQPVAVPAEPPAIYILPTPIASPIASPTPIGSEGLLPARPQAPTHLINIHNSLSSNRTSPAFSPIHSEGVSSVFNTDIEEEDSSLSSFSPISRPQPERIKSKTASQDVTESGCDDTGDEANLLITPTPIKVRRHARKKESLHLPKTPSHLSRELSRDQTDDLAPVRSSSPDIHSKETEKKPQAPNSNNLFFQNTLITLHCSSEPTAYCC